MNLERFCGGVHAGHRLAGLRERELCWKMASRRIGVWNGSSLGFLRTFCVHQFLSVPSIQSRIYF